MDDPPRVRASAGDDEVSMDVSMDGRDDEGAAAA